MWTIYTQFYVFHIAMRDILRLQLLNVPPAVFLSRSESLAFATEPVLASLANLLGSNERMPAAMSQEVKVRKPTA